MKTFSLVFVLAAGSVWAQDEVPELIVPKSASETGKSTPAKAPARRVITPQEREDAIRAEEAARLKTEAEERARVAAAEAAARAKAEAEAKVRTAAEASSKAAVDALNQKLRGAADTRARTRVSDAERKRIANEEKKLKDATAKHEAALKKAKPDAQEKLALRTLELQLKGQELTQLRQVLDAAAQLLEAKAEVKPTPVVAPVAPKAEGSSRKPLVSPK